MRHAKLFDANSRYHFNKLRYPAQRMSAGCIQAEQRSSNEPGEMRQFLGHIIDANGRSREADPVGMVNQISLAALLRQEQAFSQVSLSFTTLVLFDVTKESKMTYGRAGCICSLSVRGLLYVHSGQKIR